MHLEACRWRSKYMLLSLASSSVSERERERKSSSQKRMEMVKKLILGMNTNEGFACPTNRNMREGDVCLNVHIQDMSQTVTVINQLIEK